MVCFLNLITKHYNFLAVLSKTTWPSMGKTQILLYNFCQGKSWDLLENSIFKSKWNTTWEVVWAFHLLGWEVGLWASTQMGAGWWRSNAAPQQVNRTLLRSLGWSSTNYGIKAFKKDIFHGVAWIDSNGYFQKTAYWNHLHMFRFGNQLRSLHIVKYNGCLHQL